ncbi:MAG: radical SAM protein [Clostridia bacterium]|nr:radical SAM protein [Clostridia bacterium]
MVEALLIVPQSPMDRYCVRDKGAMGFSKAGYIFPPYDLAMIAANIKDVTSVEILDGNAKKLNITDIKKYIKKSNPNYVIFSNSTPTIDWDLNIARISKEVNPTITTVTFGPHIATLGNEVMRACQYLDVAVVNEQELTIREFIERENVKNVKGTIIREEDRIINQGIRTPLNDFGKLHFPAHDLLELGLYRLPYAKRHPVAATMTSRGCPGKCFFCLTWIISKEFRPRPSEHVLEELRFLSEELNVHEIKLWDDTFTYDMKRALSICNMIKSEKLDISWTCNTRIDRINSELLKSMKEAGCHTICLGVESGDDEILKSIGKEITTSQIKNAFGCAKSVGLDTAGFFMLGHPWDTPVTMQKTIDFAKTLDPDYASFNIVTPFPGTPLFKMAEQRGWLKTRDWSNYESTLYPVYEPDGVSRDVIWSMRNKAYKEYYIKPRYILKRVTKLQSLSDFGRDVSSFFGLLKMLAEPKKREK